MEIGFDFIDSKPPLSAMGHVVESIGLETDLQEKCKQCTILIQDRFMMRVDSRVYHEACIRCCVCLQQLDEKCYEKSGQLYCGAHYYKDCSPYRCSGCKLGISPTDMVYKLRTGMVFHVLCHCCSRCGNRLSPGEQIIVDETAKTVTCMSHFYGDQTTCPSTFASCSSESTVYTDQYNEFHIKKEIDTYGYGFEGYSFSDFCDDDNKFLKRRGPRTTIKQNQVNDSSVISLFIPDYLDRAIGNS
uniref:LIM zinc-binding domain-containing protein n=1 Tax=Heterorhabditis bacteriophora TaxID=37862 RepID=A0A1I7WNB7_HETBA